MSPSRLETPDFLRGSLRVMTCLEVPVHVFGAYCILFRTPASMSSVKWSMFNLHFWSAALDLTISLLVAPFFLFPAAAGFPLGLLDGFGVSLELQTYFCFTNFALVGVSILMIFENRFFVLFAENHWWRLARKPYLTANVLLAVAFFLPTYLMIPEQTTARAKVIEQLPSLSEEIQRIPFLVLGFTSLNILSITASELVIGFQIALFLALLVCKMSHIVKQLTLSEHSVKLHRTFLRAVLIQIAVPILVLSAPLAFVAFSLRFGVYEQSINNLVCIVLASHGLSSTVIMLLIHKPYREVCKGIFCTSIQSGSTKITIIIDNSTIVIGP